MVATPKIRTLFLDIGGVLLTNGWGRRSRLLAADTFKLDFPEMDERHHLTFDTYEVGKLTLDQYLDQTVFYTPRVFSRDDFKRFMFAQSTPFPEMISLVRDLKTRYGLRLVVVSNEGRELTTYRVEKFEMTDFIDAFVVSSFVHFRKPDADIYHIALDIAQTAPEQTAYIDDRALFVQVATGLGIHSIQHSGIESTKAALTEQGFEFSSAPVGMV